MSRITAILAAGVSLLAFASAASAADLIIEEPAAPVVIADSTWDGFYLGVFGGFANGDVYDDVDTFLELDGNWKVGVSAGADFTVTDGLVVGIVGDIEYLGLEGLEEDFVVGTDIAYDLFWAGSLRGRLGWDGGAFLPYLTAGIAFANAHVESSGGFNVAESNTHVGWTVGAGVEFAATENFSIDLLYRYTDYGTQDYDVGVALGEVGFTTHQVQAGLNWRF